jgi:hypothetical protein
MAPATRQFTLPTERFRLEEINMPEEMAASLAGRTVTVKVLPEVPSRTLRIDLDHPQAVGVSVLVDDDGNAWNDDWPARVIYTDREGREWRLPRHWLSDGVSPVIEASCYEVTQASRWTEIWVPPTPWDLGDINIQDLPGDDGGLGPPEIEVRVAPGEIPNVFWRGPSGRMWRVPHDWRRRRIKLPDRDLLLRNDFPLYVAEEFGGRIVAVNYHPDSLCCLPDGYRVRDGHGGKWPVKVADCVVVGFGDEAERYA